MFTHHLGSSDAKDSFPRSHRIDTRRRSLCYFQCHSTVCKTCCSTSPTSRTPRARSCKRPNCSTCHTKPSPSSLPTRKSFTGTYSRKCSAATNARHWSSSTAMRATLDIGRTIARWTRSNSSRRRLQNAHLLYRACNINILLFDYRGYGRSTGIPSEAGLYADAQAVYDFVRARADLNQQKIFLFGRSLGGAVALHLGKRRAFNVPRTTCLLVVAAQLGESEASPPLHCVILENTFTSIPDMAKRLFQVFILDYVPGCYYKNMVGAPHARE